MTVLVFVLAAWMATWALDRHPGALLPTQDMATLAFPFGGGDDCVTHPFSLPGGREIGETRGRLWGNGIARGHVCAPVRLVGVLEPSHEGSAPYVVVSWRGSSVWEGRVDKRIFLDAELPGAGWAAIASVTVHRGLTDDVEAGGGGLWLSEFSVVEPR